MFFPAGKRKFPFFIIKLGYCWVIGWRQPRLVRQVAVFIKNHWSWLIISATADWHTFSKLRKIWLFNNSSQPLSCSIIANVFKLVQTRCSLLKCGVGLFALVTHKPCYYSLLISSWCIIIYTSDQGPPGRPDSLGNQAKFLHSHHYHIYQKMAKMLYNCS